MDSQKLVYSEGQHYLPVGIILLVLVPVLAVGGYVVSHQTIASLVLSCVVAISVLAGLVLISLGIYHRIRLTPQTLRVGRQSLPISAIDPRIEIKLLSSQEAAGLAFLPRDQRGVLLGGAWGNPMEARVIAIHLKTAGRGGQDFVYVSSYRAQKFMTALKQLLGQV